jgi:hypothetical protein
MVRAGQFGCHNKQRIIGLFFACHHQQNRLAQCRVGVHDLRFFGRVAPRLQ